jgi:hypothetical protein
LYSAPKRARLEIPFRSATKPAQEERLRFQASKFCFESLDE